MPLGDGEPVVWSAGGGECQATGQQAAWSIPGKGAAAYLAFAYFQWRPFEANYWFSSGGSSSKGPLIALWKAN